MSSVMFQGTASNVGKSVIAAAVCRILTQDGYSVVPFKSQNMSLNSFIDKDGLEMGRAQVFQAEACNKIPRAYMNPILLKPCGNHISQIIVNGKSIGNMHSKEYQTFKIELIPVLKDIFNALEKENDLVVIEGAGSPAEININSVDISNMKMAEIANSPVILIADIDRGGVFASVVGTLALLKNEDRKKVKGVIINKFRGNKEYFKDGIKMLENIIKIPVLGVVPYYDIKIEEEDGVSSKFNRKVFQSKADFVNIEIIKLPHMSNFTDFEVFEHIEKINIRYVDKGEKIGYFDDEGLCHMPDMLIIPGSKQTISDMKYLKESGLYAEIDNYVSKKGLLIAICGGYQMLGNTIEDYMGSDGKLGEIDGFGYIKMSTVFSKHKITNQVEGIFGEEEGLFRNLEGFTIKGYELHMGKKIDKNNSKEKAIDLEYKDMNNIKINDNHVQRLIEDKEENTGVSLSRADFAYDIVDGHILGTYCHGLFDNIGFTVALINNIRKEKSLESISTDINSLEDIKESEYNKLANVVRKNIDMDSLYSIIFDR